MNEYRTVTAASEQSLTEKRSEFIAQLFPVQTADAALETVDGVKAKHHKARHNVWSYVLRDGSSRYSDDGEPQGTGGIPVLSVLQKAGLSDVCCVVTRYFGGILLGASGLTRAYSGAAALAVQNAQIQHFCEAYRIRMPIDYTHYGKLSYLLPEFEILDAGSEFGERVTLCFDIKTAHYEALLSRLTDYFGGQPPLETLETHFVDFGG